MMFYTDTLHHHDDRFFGVALSRSFGGGLRLLVGLWFWRWVVCREGGV